MKRIIIYGILLLVSLLTISVGYGALSTTLTIDGSVSFEPVGMIKIKSFEGVDNNNYVSHTSDTIETSFRLTEINSFAKYKVQVINLGEKDELLKSISCELLSNIDVEYVLSGIDINGIVKVGETVEFYITFKYKDNVSNVSNDIINTKLKFIFGDNMELNDLTYFKAYNGKEGFFGINKDNVKYFKRNTTLSLSDVEAISGKKVISSDDSSKIVYGWLDGNTYYWWSEADIVYFNPKTLFAFYSFKNMLNIDLYGTSTEFVENFSHWFDTCTSLTKIDGVIDTTGLKLEYNPSFDYANDTNNNSTSETSMAYMFNDCKALKSIDLSSFYTVNATDMKRMFGGCRSLTSIDVSNFDTRNVLSMYWMFRVSQAITDIDISNFNTSNVKNMFGMFVQTNAKTIKLGEGFDTTNVKHMDYMFYDARNLEKVYVKHDFIRSNGLVSSNMFYNNSKLVGGKDNYATPYSSSYKDATYAQIAHESQKGYFTFDGDKIKYTITYDLDGGSANNVFVYDEDDTFTLEDPVKSGYTFIGWTGTNINEITRNVTVNAGTTGNLYFEAHYEKNHYTVFFDNNGGSGEMDPQTFYYDEYKPLSLNTFTNNGRSFLSWNTREDGTGISINDGQEVGNLTVNETIRLFAIWNAQETFSKVFNLEGPCIINGSSNITGNKCVTYSSTNYINSNIKLFSEENIDKDFELSFDLSNYIPGNQNQNQATILNMQTENLSNNPGIVIRRNGNNIDLIAKDGKTNSTVHIPYNTLQSLRLIRKNKRICYSLNNGNYKFLYSFENFTNHFEVPVTFGASLNKNGVVFRNIYGTLSNMYIKLGVIDDDIVCE